MAANAQVLRNATVEMQSALGSDITITGITKASPGVVTASNSLSDGDIIVLSGIVGMTQLNGQVARVTSTSGSDFTLEGIDTSGYSTYVSGGVANEVSTFLSFDNVSQIDLPDSAPDELDITAVSDDERQVVFGHESAQKGTMSLIADPLNSAVVEAAAASKAGTRRAFRITLQGGYVVIFNAFVAGGTGFSGGVGAAATSTLSLTLRSKPQWFSS